MSRAVEVSMQIGLNSLPDRAPDPTTTDPGAQTSGPGFDRLIAAAQAEADRRKAIAAQSGASADQFTDQGWFQIVKAHGAEIGLGAAASAITKGPHGQLTINDPIVRARVINYRNDPLIRSVMAVKRASDGKAVLNLELGRQPSDAEARVALAIGGKAAGKLILTRQSTPNASAAIVAPEAAAANRALFYRPDGSPQTVDEVVARLMKPADTASTGDADRLAAGHAAFGPAGTAATPSGLTPEMAATLRAHAAFASATAPQPVAQKPKVRPGPPPDLALVSGTIANLSIPGSATGPTAPTGGKISGWRAQLAGEVTHQVEHPESVPVNAPSNVTIPAPVAGTHSTPIQTAPIQMANASAPAPQLLGPELVPSTGPAQPLPPAAYAPHEVGRQTVVAAAAQPTALPLLVSAPAAPQTSALPLLPINEQTAAQPAAPVASTQALAFNLTPAGNQPDPAPPSEPQAAEPQIIEPPARPSRYGPGGGNSQQAMQGSALGYAAGGQGNAPTPVYQSPAAPDASAAGIRPSRYYANAAQQYSALSRQQPVVPAAAPTPSVPAAPLPDPAALGPDGMPLLPPVPPRAGLPPITATQALQPTRTAANQPFDPAILGGNKPLDLAPSAPIAVAPQVQSPPAPRNRPRLTPAFLSRS